VIILQRIVNGNSRSSLKPVEAIEQGKKAVIFFSGTHEDTQEDNVRKGLNGYLKQVPEQLLGGRKSHNEYAFLGALLQDSLNLPIIMGHALNGNILLGDDASAHPVFWLDETDAFVEQYLMPLMPKNNDKESIATAEKKLKHITIMSHSYGGSVARQCSLSLAIRLSQAGIELRNIHRLISSLAHVSFGNISVLPPLKQYGEPHFTTFSFAHHLDPFPELYSGKSILWDAQRVSAAKKEMAITPSSPNVAECGVWIEPGKEIVKDGATLRLEASADEREVHKPMWLTYPDKKNSSKDAAKQIILAAQTICNRNRMPDSYEYLCSEYGVNAAYWKNAKLPDFNSPAASPINIDQAAASNLMRVCLARSGR